MVINDVTITDPSEYSIELSRTSGEATTLTGDRRYILLKTKHNVVMNWNALDATDKGKIETANDQDDPLTVALNGETHTLVPHGSLVFQRHQGPNEYYRCMWELREP